MIRVEKCGIKDMAILVDSEVATQEFPRLGPEVRPYLADLDKEANTALISNTLVGYALTASDSGKKVVTIDSIGVRQKYRRKGVGSKLVKHISDRARWLDYKTQMLTPSYLIEDKEDPWNLEEWLWKIGFKAIGETADGCFQYGRNYGVYIFEKMK